MSKLKVKFVDSPSKGVTESTADDIKSRKAEIERREKARKDRASKILNGKEFRRN